MKLLHIGRATNNDIVVADQTVSRQHAQLMIDDVGQVSLIDLNSANGTFVNGRRINSPTRLDHSDIVKVGEYLLPWRQYTQASPQTQVGASSASPMSAAVQNIYSSSGDYSTPPKKSKTLLYVVSGGAAVLVVVVLLVWLLGGTSKPDLAGKWNEKEDAQTWIKFEEGGKYTEGFKDAVVYDSATWKAMGVDRILIKKGEIEVSKRYKFDGKNLLITYNGVMTEYVRNEK